MAKVTPDMIIADVLKMDKGTVPIFLNNGLHCLDALPHRESI